jgi:hypothetical protein
MAVAAQQPVVRTPETATQMPLLRRCACGGTRDAGGECSACRARRLQRMGAGAAPGIAPPVVHDVLRSPGTPLAAPVRSEMEQRLGHDFSRVRVHTDAQAAASARAVDAHAYAVGPHIAFGAGTYAPATSAGKQLLAHELTHTVQQADVTAAPGSPLPIGAANDPAERGATAAERAPTLRREPVYPDGTCDNVKGNITRAWPTARSWVQNANRRLSSPRDVASALGHHFKLDPNDTAQAADVAYVQRVMARVGELFDMDLQQRCDAPNAGDQCHLPDGREYGAWTYAGNVAEGIHHCITNADHGVLMGEYLIETLVHEIAHIADNSSTDIAYHSDTAGYAAMTRAQALVNADSYSEFARELYEGGLPRATSPLLLGLGTGVLLGGGSPRPQWVITASYGGRSHTGLEYFDLVGGIHGFIGLGDDPAGGNGLTARRIGGSVDIGVLSRSARTGFFVDVRAGAFMSGDIGQRDPATAGVSANALVGWASSGFRIGVNTQLLYDVLQSNHGAIIGIEIGGTP